MKIEVLNYYRTKNLTIKLIKIDYTYKVIQEDFYDIVVADIEHENYRDAINKFKDLILYYL